MSRHLEFRTPNKTRRFALGGVLTDDGSVVTYRWFRRKQRNAMQSHAASYFNHTEQTIIAGQLCRARRHLRDLVDEIDLRAMGVEGWRGERLNLQSARP